LILLSEWIQEEEDMDRRPKRRIWSGDDYESDPDEVVEDEKANTKNSNLTAHMR
jgi:histone deacetylase 1/2